MLCAVYKHIIFYLSPCIQDSKAWWPQLYGLVSKAVYNVLHFILFNAIDLFIRIQWFFLLLILYVSWQFPLFADMTISITIFGILLKLITFWKKLNCFYLNSNGIWSNDIYLEFKFHNELHNLYSSVVFFSIN